MTPFLDLAAMVSIMLAVGALGALATSIFGPIPIMLAMLALLIAANTWAEPARTRPRHLSRSVGTTGNNHERHPR